MSQKRISQYADPVIADDASSASSIVMRGSDGGITVGPIAGSSLTLTGNEAGSIIAKTAGYTAAGETTITCTGAFTVTLPPAASCSGRRYAIKKTDATTSLVIDGSGTETIDGAVTKTSTVQYSALVIQSDGTSWHIISTMGTWS